MLLGCAKALYLFDDGGEELLGRQICVLPQGLDEPFFAELFSDFVEGFGYAVGVEREDVACCELALDDGRVPLLEESEDCTGGMKQFDCAVTPQQNRRKMPAVCVSQALCGVVVVGEEDRGIGAVDRVLVEEAIHGLQKEQGLFAGEGELAAQVGLQVRHEQRGGDAFSCDVADDEAEALVAQGEKVVVIAADVTGLDAEAGVVEGLERGLALGE